VSGWREHSSPGRSGWSDSSISTETLSRRAERGSRSSIAASGGETVYEITPCFDERLYRLGDHLDRLYRSLRYVRILPRLDRSAMEERPLGLLEANSGRLTPGDMYRVGHFVTRGLDTPTMAARVAGRTVCIFFRPVDITRYRPGLAHLDRASPSADPLAPATRSRRRRGYRAGTSGWRRPP
jgi:hypothetical protein